MFLIKVNEKKEITPAEAKDIVGVETERGMDTVCRFIDSNGYYQGKDYALFNLLNPLGVKELSEKVFLGKYEQIKTLIAGLKDGDV